MASKNMKIMVGKFTGHEVEKLSTQDLKEYLLDADSKCRGHAVCNEVETELAFRNLDPLCRLVA